MKPKFVKQTFFFNDMFIEKNIFNKFKFEYQWLCDRLLYTYWRSLASSLQGKTKNL